MFTGLVQLIGIVKENVVLMDKQAHRLIIACDIPDCILGESIAVNGVCLTVVHFEKGYCAFDVSQETLSCTHLGDLQSGCSVNLERAMLASERFGGHYVTGHIDTTACIQSIHSVDTYMQMEIGAFALASSPLYLIPKGSITLDGVSLTINAVYDDLIQIMLVPHTLAETTFSVLKVGHRLNVEFDYIARVVAHQLRNSKLFENEDLHEKRA